MKPLNLDPNVDYLSQYTAPVDIPEWRKSLGSFASETKALGSGLKALGAQALGAEETRDAALADYQRNMDEASSGWKTPEVGRIEDIKLTEDGGVGRFGAYLAHTVPKGIAQLGALALGGGVAGGVAKATASTAIKQLAKQGVKKSAEKLVKRQLAAAGGAVAAGGFGMETGQSYGQFATDPEIGPEKAVGPALAYGGVASVLEFMPIAAGAKAIGLNRMLLRKVIKADPELSKKAIKLAQEKKKLGLTVRALKATGKVAGKVGGAAVAGAGVEGITEGMQSLAQLAAERYAKEDPEWASIVPRTPEEWSGFWNEAAAGAATGFFAGAAAGPFTGTPQAKQPVPEPQPESVQEPIVPDAQAPLTPTQTPATPPVDLNPEVPGVVAPQTDPEAQPETTQEPVAEAVIPEAAPDESLVDYVLRASENGVPPAVYDKLHDAATEAGVVVTEEMQPQDVVDAIKARRGDVVVHTTSPQEASQETTEAAPNQEGLSWANDEDRWEMLTPFVESGQVTEEDATTLLSQDVAPDFLSTTQLEGAPDGLSVQENPEATPEVFGETAAQEAATPGPASAVATTEKIITEPTTIESLDDISTLIEARKQKHKQKFSKLNFDGKSPTHSRAGLHAPAGGWISETGTEFAPGEFIPLDADEREAFGMSFPEKKAKVKILKKDMSQVQEILGNNVDFGKEFIGDDGKPRVMAYVKGTANTVAKINDLLPKTTRQLITVEKAKAQGKELGKTWKFSLKKAVLSATAKDSMEDGLPPMPITYDNLKKEGWTDQQVLELLQEQYPGLTTEHFGKEVGYAYSDNTLQFKSLATQQNKLKAPAQLTTQKAPVPVETIRKADGTAFKDSKTATARMNQMWNRGELKIQKGKEAGKQARARVVQEGDGYVIEKLESRDSEVDTTPTNITQFPLLPKSVTTAISKWVSSGGEVSYGGLADALKSSDWSISNRQRQAITDALPEDAVATSLRALKRAEEKGYTGERLVNRQRAADRHLLVNYLQRTFPRKYLDSKPGTRLERQATISSILADLSQMTEGAKADIKRPRLTVVPNTLESRTDTPTKATTSFVATTDAALGQGWTQRAIDAGLLVVNETSPKGSVSGSFNPETNQLTVNLDKIPPRQTIVDVLLHEGSHAGLEVMLGDQFKGFHSDLLKLVGMGDPTAVLAIERATWGSINAINKHREKVGLEPFPHRVKDKTLPEGERKAELDRVRKLIDELNPRLLPEEDLAYYVQTASSTAPTSMGFWNRLKRALQAWFAGTDFGKALAGIGWRPELAPDFAVALAKAATRQTLVRVEANIRLVGARSKVLTELPVGANAGLLESAVWHAGPNPWAPEPQFPRGRPRLDKVGTGEGGQLFGWGWYSAENEKVSGPEGEYAKTFAYQNRERQLFHPLVTYNGEVFEAGPNIKFEGKTPEQLAVWALVNADMSRKWAKSDLRTTYQAVRSSYTGVAYAKLKPLLEAAVAAVDQIGLADISTQEQAGVSVYRLDIPDESIARMIQWEKPLSEQTEEVKAALTQLPSKLFEYDPVNHYQPSRDMTAEQLYHGLMDDYVLPHVPGEHPKKKVSEYLNSLGIVGNKYLDFGSRGETKQQTYNYVVWNQDVLDRTGQQHLDQMTGEVLESRDSGVPNSWSKGGKPDEAAIAETLYSMPSVDEWGDSKTWLTSATSTMPEDYNTPGVFNKAFHGMVDRFDYVKGKSLDLYRAFDEWKNRQGALQQEIKRTYLDPMRHLVSRYQPTEADAEPIRRAQVAAGVDKAKYTDVEITGHQLAARHILEDKVTEKLALKAAPEFLKELKKELSPHNVGLLNNAIKAMTGDSIAIDELATPQARQLFETYLPAKKPDSDIATRWELYNRRSAGYSIAQPGTKAAKEDTAAGFINAHELYTPQVKNREIFKQIGELSDQLAAHQLKLLQEGGVLEQSSVDKLSSTYKHYVPLRREAFDYDQELKEMFEKPVANVGKLMTRKGSIELPSAVHVLQNHLASGFTAASAAARNQMMNKFADEIYKDQSGWKSWFYIKDERVHKNDVGFIRNGKPLYIVPAEGNLRAASIVKVIAGKDAQDLSGPLKIMRSVNNWIRWSNVSASPAFLLANTPRDYLTAVYNLQASDAKDYVKEIASLKAYKESFKALHKVMVQGVRESDDPQVQEWIDLVESFERAGGKTSFVEALRAMDGGSWKSFEAQVKRRKGKLGGVVEFGADQLERIENLNIVLENVMRLSTYKVMRNKYQTDPKFNGMTQLQAEERAAEIARNLTTNFTRRGAHIDAMNTWWLFYNATVQGNWQVIQNLFLNPNKAGQRKLQKAVAGTILFAFLIDQLGRAMSDDEDDDGVSDWDSRPGHEKDRKISAPFSVGGVFPAISAPWVFNVFWRLGGMLGEVKDGVLTPQDAVLDTMGLVFTTMNPISSGTPAQAIAPSAFDPFMQIIENRNFVGNPLGPDGFPGSTTRPDSYLAWDSTPAGYKHVAEFVNDVTGGSPVESGEADFRPSSYKVLTEFALGSLGRTIVDLGKLGLSPVMDGMDFEGPEKVPGLKVFLTAPSDSTAISHYHDRVAKVLGAKRLTKLYSAGVDKDSEKLAEVQRDRAAVLRMVPQVEDTERQIRSLRKAIRGARGNSRTEETLRNRIVQLQKRFNQSYTRRIGN